MAHPIVTSLTVTAGVVNGIALAQALPGASGLSAVLNGSLVTGGVATLSVPRRVLITSAGNDSGITFTVTGTARSQQGGAVLTENVTGGNVAAVATTQDFATVTAFAASGATASTVQIGTNTTASGPWVPWDQYVPSMNIGFAGVVLSGTPGYQLDYTMDDVFGTWLGAASPFPNAISFAGFAAKNSSGNGHLMFPVRATRLTVTGVGGAQLTQIQAQGVI